MIKLTSKRKLVYDFIKSSNKPVDAILIYKNIGKEKINLSTVYRAIDFLVSHKLLLTFYFNDKSYYILNDEDKHYHYFICTNCLHMKKIKCNMHTIINNLENEYNYKVLNHEMNVYGLCNSCVT